MYVTCIRQTAALLGVPLLLLLTGSCKKFVDVPPPPGELTTGVVFGSDATALAALHGLYSDMMTTTNQLANSAVTLYAGMAADELYYYHSGYWDQFVQNELSPGEATLEACFWEPAYRTIYAANACIQGAHRSTTISDATRRIVVGEASFVRAFTYFYLTQLFGAVPLVTTTDYRTSQSLPRTARPEVFAQILQDLAAARALLSPSYPTAERVRPNLWAATALQARVHLYQGDWARAEALATDIIESGTYRLEADPALVFLRSSREALWQLAPVNPDRNTHEAREILPASPGAAPTYLLTPAAVSAFDSGDLRKGAWTAARTYNGQVLYYPCKYKVRGSTGNSVTEYYTVLRLGEQYLIRAEARVRQDQLVGGRQDLNTVRQRAGLPPSTAATREALLRAIEEERRVELISEWGHRWFDLIRTGRATAVFSRLKPATWQPTDVLWPVPEKQRLLNPQLTQNEGY